MKVIFAKHNGRFIKINIESIKLNLISYDNYGVTSRTTMTN